MIVLQSSLLKFSLRLIIALSMTLPYEPYLCLASSTISRQSGQQPFQDRDTQAGTDGPHLIAEGRRLYESHTTEDLHRAFTDFEAARRLCGAARDRNCEELSLIYLGLISHDLGNYEQSVAYDRQALAIATVLQDALGEARVLTNLSVVLIKIGNYAEAAQDLKRSLEIHRKLVNLRGVVLALLNLGSLENILGDFPNAQRALEEALELNGRQGDQSLQAGILMELANSLVMSRQLRPALQRVDQAIRLESENDPHGQAQDLLMRSQIRRNLGDVVGAMDDLYDAADIFKRLRDSVGEAGALANLGILAELIGSYDKALAYYQQAFSVFGKTNEPEHLWRIRRGLAVCFWKLKQPERAQQEFRLAMATIEKLRAGAGTDRAKISYFDTKQIFYGQYIEFLFDQHQDIEALEVAEAGRTRALVDLMRSHETVAGLNPSTVRADQVKLIAARLDSCILEYFATQRGLAIWLVTPNGQIFSKLLVFDSGGDNLAALVRNLRDTLSASVWEVSRLRNAARATRDCANTQPVVNSQPPTGLAEVSRRLYQLLFPHEIEQNLPTGKSTNLILIPHEELFLVPFSLLEDEHGRMLIDRFKLSVSPSITVLAEADKRHRERNSRGKIGAEEVLIMGDPKMPLVNGMRLCPLDGARAEVLALAEEFGTPALMQDNATETEFKRKAFDKRIIHLATHGLANDDNPMDGFVALAPTPTDDGLLTAAEVADLRLRADLVVLSACQSGLGHITGDGVVGLSRAFILAGADSVVVSLWKVDDNSAAALMKEFYKGLSSGKSKATALSDAMQSTRKRFPDPYDWAPFVLIGEPQ